MNDTVTQQRPFVKMHGLGNDFVVFDARQAPLSLAAGRVRALADRHTGIGCDQLIVLHPSDAADVYMEIRNADGGEVAACGNATRCVARLVMGETGRETARIETGAGILDAAGGPGGGVAVTMGPPGLDWRDIPLARPMETARLDYAHGPFTGPGAVSMGNPHVVFFADETPDTAAFAEAAPAIEHDPLFPDRANVTLARILEPGHLSLSVWERGAGFTQACGTAACAALVAAHRRGLCAAKARVSLPGGDLHIQWDTQADTVIMAGPAALAFYGAVDLSLTEAEAAE